MKYLPLHMKIVLRVRTNKENLGNKVIPDHYKIEVPWK